MHLVRRNIVVDLAGRMVDASVNSVAEVNVRHHPIRGVVAIVLTVTEPFYPSAFDGKVARLEIVPHRGAAKVVNGRTRLLHSSEPETHQRWYEFVPDHPYSLGSIRFEGPDSDGCNVSRVSIDVDENGFDHENETFHG